MIKKTVNIRSKWKDIEKKPTHKVDIIGALCLKQLQTKHDFPAFNGFICDECRSSWIERNICTPWWNDCCKKQHQRQWQNSNIPNLLKPQLKLRTTYESKFHHLSNKKPAKMKMIWFVHVITRTRCSKTYLNKIWVIWRRVALITSPMTWLFGRSHMRISWYKMMKKRCVWKWCIISWQLEIYKGGGDSIKYQWKIAQ